MKLRRLQIDRLPGIDPGFALEGDHFGEGVHVVVGPNAIGKSSLVRAVRALLFEEPLEGAAVLLEARLEDDGGEGLTVVRQGREVTWTRAGRPVPPPSLPDARFASCYTIRVEDLLADDQTDAEIARRIATALAGGFDLPALLDAEPFKIKSNHGRAERARLEEAERALAARARAQGDLRREEERLGELERRREDARRAEGEARRWKAGRALLDARREVRRAEEALAAFPPAMERLSRSDAGTLASLRRKLDAKREGLEAARRKAAEARRLMDESGLAQGPLDRPMLAAWRSRLERLKEAERRRLEAEREAARTAAQLASAARDLGKPAEAIEIGVTPEAVRRAEAGVLRRREAAEALQAIRERRALLARGASGAASPDRAALRLGAVAAGIALLALTAAAGSVIAGALVHPLYLGLLAVVGGALALVRPGWRALADEERRRMRRADRDLAEDERLAAEERTSEEQLQGAERALRGLAGEIGFDPGVLDASFERWLRLLEAYDRARDEEARARGELVAAQEQEAGERAGVAALLARAGARPRAGDDDDTAALEARLADLEERHRRYEKAQDAARESEERISELCGEIDGLEGEIAGFFGRFDLEPGDDAAFERLQAGVPAWREARQDLDSARGAERVRDAGVRDPEIRALVEAGDDAGLEAGREEAERRAGGLEDLRNRIAGIQHRVEAARGGSGLEEARAERDAAREALRARLEEDLFAEAGRLLLEEVQAEQEQEARPEVLERAGEWFGRFTHHAFEILAPRPDERLRARDVTSREERSLGALSSGTRTQLLLAVRLAFLPEAERGHARLPIFLDEALTTTDPARFRAVAQALAEFARSEDRQVFYLSSQPADRAIFREMLGEALTTIDLEAVRARAWAIEEPGEIAPPAPPAPQIPAPAGSSPEEYALRIGVGPIDPWGPAGAMHVFYLLRDDLPLLAGLLRYNITTAGQLESLLGSEEAQAAVADESKRRLLARRIRAAGIIVEARREGRGRPVSGEALRKGGVSETYLPRLESLAREKGNDARALLEAIRAGKDRRVKGFRRASLEQLEEYFLDQRHLDDRPLLSVQQTILRVAARMGRAGGLEGPEAWEGLVRWVWAGLTAHRRG